MKLNILWEDCGKEDKFGDDEVEGEMMCFNGDYL